MKFSYDLKAINLAVIFVFVVMMRFMAAADDGSVTLSWRIQNNSGSSHSLIKYDIRYLNALISESNWSAAHRIDNLPAPSTEGSDSITVKGLKTGETYYFAMKVCDEVPNWSRLSSNFIVVIPSTIPASYTGFTLSDNYPNPFNTSTTIEYSIPNKSHVLISVYNINGQLVTTLFDQSQDAGAYEISWDGTDHNRRAVATGIYICKVRSGRYSSSTKMVLLK